MEEDIRKSKKNDLPKNLIFMGYFENNKTPYLMQNMDILLMPYEKNVYLSKKTTNTAVFMSPMKMFEYMSTGVPFISTNLEVLKEILIDNYNCLLADEQNLEDWNQSILKLLKNTNFAKELGNNAKNDLENKYTWLKRVQNIINFYKYNEL